MLTIQSASICLARGSYPAVLNGICGYKAPSSVYGNASSTLRKMRLRQGPNTPTEAKMSKSGFPPESNLGRYISDGVMYGSGVVPPYPRKMRGLMASSESWKIPPTGPELGKKSSTSFNTGFCTV